MKRAQAGVALVVSLLIASSAFAHHSAAGFDATKTITVEGTVVQFTWTNPHCWLEMMVVNSKGESEAWNIEMGGVGVLVRNGWKAKTLKPGDKIKLTGRPLRTGELGALYVSVVLPDGKELGGGSGAPGRN